MERFDAFGRRLMWRVGRLFCKNSARKSEDKVDFDDRELSSYRQLYLLFHHVGYYFWILASTGFTKSFLSDYPWLFYAIVFLLTLSLDFYSRACGPPGFVTEEPPNPDGLFFCQVCQLHCPLRAMHCRTCNRCVQRRDHHCPWTGTCVGRDNHLMFLLFLFTEAMLMILVCSVIFLGMFEKKPPLQWISDNWGSLCIIALCLFDLGLVCGLAFSHVRWAMYNVTTWELSRRDRITYMKGYPVGSYPFSRGWLENLKEFLTMAHTKKVWEKPNPPELSQFDAERRNIMAMYGDNGQSMVDNMMIQEFIHRQGRMVR